MENSYFKLSNELVYIEDIKEYISLMKGVIKQLNLSTAECNWFKNQLYDDIELRRNSYKDDVYIVNDKFKRGYEAPPQLKAKRVAGGIILEYENQYL